MDRLHSKRHRLILAVVVALLITSLGLGSAMAAPMAKDKDKKNASQHGRRAATSMLMNIAPPPPPGSPKAAMAAWRGMVEASGVTAQSTAAAMATGGGISATATAKTLVLYDIAGAYGFLGELYAIGGSNFSSHFGTWTAKPVANYVAGEITNYTAVLYFGSTYDEPIPAAFLDDVLASATPVLWSDYNIWQLANRNSTAFQAKYGWNAATSYFDASSQNSATPVNQVQYKGKTLRRDGVNNLSGILNPQTPYSLFDTTKVTTLANAVRADGTTFPWAIRSGNLTYVGEIPFAYMKEEDRYLIYADLMFDLYGQTQVQHRAMVRLEDINPTSDPAELKAIADYLYSQGVPFGFGVSPLYKDPFGYYTGTNCTPGVQCGPAEKIRLSRVTALVDTIKYLLAHGGTLIEHGYTHQWDGGINPYTGVTGDDFEFYRVVENPDHTLTFQGPVPNDSISRTASRISSANNEFAAAGLAKPTIFEFPHYAGSAASYRAVGQNFSTRWERSLYFNGLLRGGTVSYSRIFGQLFPYAVRDVYGTKVLPENLGNIEPEPFYQFPTRFPQELINAAALNLVVRDGVACFYFHPFWWSYTDPTTGQQNTYLQDTVAGIKALGYTFVAPTSIAP